MGGGERGRESGTSIHHMVLPCSELSAAYVPLIIAINRFNSSSVVKMMNVK